MSGKQLIKRLNKEGWKLDRVIGSHHIMVKDNKTLSFPTHSNKDLSKGLLHSLMKQGGLK
jgi:predicted RNA binding protein YcfA (HicA-like mRNA interferase family)